MPEGPGNGDGGGSATSASRDALTLPNFSNPLARALSKRLAYVREERELNVRDAAKQAGLSSGRWWAIEKHCMLPSPAEAERLAKWAFEGVDYSKSTGLKPRKKVSRGAGWAPHKYHLPKKETTRLRRTCRRMGLTISMFTQLAVERLLDNEPVLGTLEDAAREIERARITDLVNSDKNIEVLLKGELELAIEMGAKLVPEAKVSGRKPAIQKFDEPEPEPYVDDSWEIL